MLAHLTVGEVGILWKGFNDASDKLSDPKK